MKYTRRMSVHHYLPPLLPHANVSATRDFQESQYSYTNGFAHPPSFLLQCFPFHQNSLGADPCVPVFCFAKSAEH